MDLAIILIAFSIWLPTVGYVLGLGLVAGRRGETRPREPAVWPRVAVLLPVLDEERWIGDRLREFGLAGYPADLLELFVINGGSRDATLASVEAAVAADSRVRLLRVEDTRAKLEQVRLALEKVDRPGGGRHRCRCRPGSRLHPRARVRPGGRPGPRAGRRSRRPRPAGPDASAAWPEVEVPTYDAFLRSEP